MLVCWIPNSCCNTSVVVTSFFPGLIHFCSLLFPSFLFILSHPDFFGWLLSFLIFPVFSNGWFFLFLSFFTFLELKTVFRVEIRQNIAARLWPWWFLFCPYSAVFSKMKDCVVNVMKFCRRHQLTESQIKDIIDAIVKKEEVCDKGRLGLPIMPSKY